MAEFDVAEFSAAGAVIGVAVDARRRPDVITAVVTRCDHLHCFCPPKRFLLVVGYPHDEPFTRDRVRNEHDTAIVTRHTDTPVRNVGNVYFDHSA